MSILPAIAKVNPVDEESGIVTPITDISSLFKYIEEKMGVEPKKIVFGDIEVYGWCVDNEVVVVSIKDQNVIWYQESNFKEIVFEVKDEIHLHEFEVQEDDELRIVYNGESKILFHWRELAVEGIS